MPRSNRYYDYIIEMIEASEFEDRALLEKFRSEKPDNKKSFYHKIHEATKFSEYTKPDKQQAYQILIEAVFDYLLSYPSTFAAKHHLYTRLYAWCNHIGVQYKIEGYQEYLDDIASPLITDVAVEIVKELHDRQGITKSGLSDKCKLSKKSIQVYLSKIGNKKCSDPMRIGGQAIYVPITRKKSNTKDGEWRYYTENTLSPLVFQMNITQIGTLMKSLQLNYESGNDIPLDLAVDTWSQLSEYARNRIREIFGKRDDTLNSFLDEVERNVFDDEYRFMTESEMMKGENISISEQLLIADKGGLVCDLSLLEPLRTRKNQRIIFDHVKNSYYAVSADDINSANRLYFTEDEVNIIEEI